LLKYLREAGPDYPCNTNPGNFISKLTLDFHAFDGDSMASLRSTLQVKTHCCAQKQGFGYPQLAFKKGLHRHPLKPTEPKPSFWKVNLSPAKLVCFPVLAEWKLLILILNYHDSWQAQ